MCDSQWKDIETAPRDGTYVLLFWPYWRTHRPVIGRWFHGNWDCAEVLEGENPPPTHWMPLPAPPEAGR